MSSNSSQPSARGSGAPPSMPPQEWTVGGLVKWATDDFRARGMSSPRLDAELIVGHVTGLTRTQMMMSHERQLQSAELAEIRALIKRRRNHEPIAYLRGVREFYGREFKVDARVLVPRPETEHLVEVGLKRTEHLGLGMRAMDLCTGSGCIAVSLAKERPTARLLGVDISEGAIAVAKDNAARLGAYNVAFLLSDLFSLVPVAQRVGFDLIASNPPYIARAEVLTLDADVRDHEPRLALDGGEDGYVYYERIVAESRNWLADGGVMAFEVGAGQAPRVLSLMQDAGFSDLQMERDLARIERVVSGVWAGASRVVRD